MQIWPGQPYPLGATFDGVGTNFSIFSESARTRRAVPVRRRRRGNARRPAGGDGALLARLSAGRPAGTALRLSRPRPWAPEQGQWCNPNKLLLDPYAKAIEGRWEWNEAVFPYHFARSRAVAERSGQRAVLPAIDRHQPVLRLGQRSAAEHAVAQDGHLRDAREGLHQAAPRDPGGAARHLRRAWRTRPRSSTCSGSASPRSSCCRSTSSSRTRR